MTHYFKEPAFYVAAVILAAVVAIVVWYANKKTGFLGAKTLATAVTQAAPTTPAGAPQSVTT